MNVPQEPDEIRGTRIVVEQFVVESHARRPWCATKCRQRRYPVVATPRILLRRISCGGPYSPSQRLKQIATFVEKNDASLLLEALFLAAANPRGSSGQWRLRPAHVPGRRASGDSNPAHGATATLSHGGTERQTAAQSNPERVDLSNLTGHTPNISSHATWPLPIWFVAARKASTYLLGVVSHVTCSHAATRASNDMPRKHCIPRPRPLPSTSFPARTSGPRLSDGLRALPGFL